MTLFILLLICFLLTETLVAVGFAVIAQVFYKKIGFDFKSIFKGTIERLFLTIALINGLTSALTFFSALKLATRLKHKEEPDEHNKFNDYYLLGNLISVTVAILYVYVYQHVDTIPLFYKLTH